jgi:tRNA pseudouridine13 synthase
MTDERSPLTSELPYLTATAGIGGKIKQSPEDFFVEELPAYELSGEGEWLFLLIEKRDLSTPALVDHISNALGIPRDQIGTAGRKDGFAVTRQFVCVPARSFESADQIETDRIAVLEQRRHGNKLRTGHLRGNRFRILLRDVSINKAGQTDAIVSELKRVGFPNWFGEQRFGARDDSDEFGLRLLRGERTRRVRKDSLRFALSAAQSRLFNQWAAARIRDGLSHRVLPGDVMQVATSGGPFVVQDVPTEQARFDDRETMLTGPIFGPKMKRPDSEAAEREQLVLDDFDLTPESFERFRRLTAGTRRPLLVFVDDLDATTTADGLQLRFSLPPGAYATSLLREICKDA